MKILFLGDVFGKIGRQAVKALLPKLRDQHGADVCFANCENSAGGAGVTPETVKELLDAGCAALTSGDHIWDQRDVMKIIDAEPRLVRPLNFPPNTPGRGSTVVSIDGRFKIGLLNALGRTFMKPMDCPFRALEPEVAKLRQQTPILLVDFHAEATSDKNAMGWFLDGKVSAVFGTHTHVQTADERILPKGTAFITDLGFCGPRDSVIGVQIEPIIARYLTGMPKRYEPASGPCRVCGIVLDIDESSGKARSIERIHGIYDMQPPMDADKRK